MALSSAAIMENPRVFTEQSLGHSTIKYNTCLQKNGCPWYSVCSIVCGITDKHRRIAAVFPTPGAPKIDPLSACVA